MSGRKVTVTPNQQLAEEIKVESVVNIKVEETPSLEKDTVEIAKEKQMQVEDLEDTQEIWEGGPAAGQIKLWKKQYGEIYVTSITFDKHIVWRVLTRIEYKNLVKKMEQLVQAGQLTSAEANMWNEEAIAEMCILYPQYEKLEMNGIMAGIPSLISQEVLEASGFVALEVRQL
jgi:hypothetical protein